MSSQVFKRVAGAVAVVAGAALISVSSAPPASALPASLTVIGHGYGHGRGMGQYGALGYAADGWSFQQILAQYYGGTTAATTTDTGPIPVVLEELNGASSVAVSVPAGQTISVNGTDTGKDSVTLARGDTAAASNGTDLTVAGPWSTGSTRQFAGTITLPAGSTDVINDVPLLQYVEGVVPREMPASWPEAALEAQAVAARTYALAYLVRNGVSAICDNSYCQNYGGDPSQYSGGDSAASDAAVTATGDEVLECAATGPCGQSGELAYTEYSASTGGYTAGGEFPAVADAGDQPPSPYYNPYHDWSVSLDTSTVQSAFPQVGTLQSIQFLSRNGYGDWGGRVEEMELSGTGGSVQVSGAQFAAAVGLLSDWFTITQQTAPAGSDSGYWVAGADGSVFAYGSAQSYGSMAGRALNAPVVGMAPTSDDGGYWLVGADGGVFNFGDAGFYGSTGNLRLAAPVVGMAATPDSGGYWLVGADGGVFNFGDAGFYGSTGNLHLVKPAVGIAPTPDGKGYWIVAADGGVFAFGDAGFYGSAAMLKLDAPMVGIVPTADGKGYWMVAADGGVFAFGDATFTGSDGGSGQTGYVSVSPTPDGDGYLLVTSSGSVHPFGDATWLGDPSNSDPNWSGQAVGVYTG